MGDVLDRRIEAGVESIDEVEDVPYVDELVQGILEAADAEVDYRAAMRLLSLELATEVGGHMLLFARREKLAKAMVRAALGREDR